MYKVLIKAGMYVCSTSFLDWFSPYDRQWYELNVASGQSLIGSIIGFSLVVAGKDSIIWLSSDPKSIPPYKVRGASVLS